MTKILNTSVETLNDPLEIHETKTETHTYMVAYICKDKKFGSLILEEKEDTTKLKAEQLAYFHKHLTTEISEYEKQNITILNIVRFN